MTRQTETSTISANPSSSSTIYLWPTRHRYYLIQTNKIRRNRSLVKSFRRRRTSSREPRLRRESKPARLFVGGQVVLFDGLDQRQLGDGRVTPGVAPRRRRRSASAGPGRRREIRRRQMRRRRARPQVKAFGAGDADVTFQPGARLVALRATSTSTK